MSHIKKATNWMKNHRLFTVIILFLFIIAVILCFHFSTTYINLSKVSYIHMSISSYNLDDPTEGKLVLEIDNPNEFEETQQFVQSVQKLSGYNPFSNRSRWYVKIEYIYKNGKTKFRIISGDRNFEELTGIIQEFQSELQ